MAHKMGAGVHRSRLISPNGESVTFQVENTPACVVLIHRALIEAWIGAAM